MIFNGEDIGIGEVEANYGYFIKVSSKDNKYRLFLNFSEKEFDFRKMELNLQIDANKYFYWDTSLAVGESYYLFDISKDDVFITRIDDNRYKLEVNIEDPDTIYSPLGGDFKFDSLKISTEFSFAFDYKPKVDPKILDSLKDILK